MSLVATSELLLWAAVIVLSLTVVALARQIGVLHERIAPMGALKIDAGITVGKPAPVMSLKTLTGAAVEVGGAQLRRQLLLFVAPGCPICKKIIPIARSFVEREHLELIFVSDGDAQDQARMVERLDLKDFAFINSPEVGMRMGVGKLPYAVLIDQQGVVAGAGLVNSREHLESLVVAQETGHPSVQSYLATLNHSRPN
jgi:methylamine dehydrogenase accessory protein MauD